MSDQVIAPVAHAGLSIPLFLAIEPVTEAARLLGTKAARVYVAKHRLSKLLLETVGELEKAENSLELLDAVGGVFRSV